MRFSITVETPDVIEKHHLASILQIAGEKAADVALERILEVDDEVSILNQSLSDFGVGEATFFRIE